MTGEWRKLHNEELNDLYSLPNIFRAIKSRKMRWAGHLARMGKRRGVYRFLVGKYEGKRPLRRPTHRCEDNFDTHGSVHLRLLSRNTNKMQLCNIIYYPKVY